MKKLTLKNALDATFLAILLVFSVLVYSTWNRAQLVKQNRLSVNKTSNINDVLEKILSSTINIETGTRGYTITGENDYLSVYKDGHENVKMWIDSLKNMTKGDTIAPYKIDSLQELIEDKKAISAITIKTRREQGMEAAAAIVKTGKGKMIMDSIRLHILNYQKQELRSLGTNLTATEDNVHARNVNFIIFASITFLIVFVAYVMLRRTTKALLQDKIIQENLMDELTFQNQQLNDFASITSHNLRSPASNITSLVASVEEDSTIDEYKMLFEMLKKVAQNLNESLNQLMEVLHIKRNKLIEKENLTFRSILDKTIDSLQGEIHRSDAVITGDFDKAPEILYSRIYLDSIFHNLVSNALKYRDPKRKPEIRVSTEKKGGHIYLQVSDNGLGIDMARHGHKLFGMHQIFHNHPEAKGVGLFMTKTQIESMKGRISVESEVGKGTTFTVMFGA
ncbi:CHASE3 domain-containing protein [Flavobacterium sp.]|uniref:sensor histidine kinase n=1 Tax=Flavobacterium sp. TaxID=239 RepID=UPI0039E6BC12